MTHLNLLRNQTFVLQQGSCFYKHTTAELLGQSGNHPRLYSPVWAKQDSRFRGSLHPQGFRIVADKLNVALLC